MARYETRSYVAAHQFYVVDAGVSDVVDDGGHGRGQHGEVDWNALGGADGVVTVFTPRGAGNVPVQVEVSTTEPSGDLAHWSQVSEGNLRVRSGCIRVEGEHNEASEPALEIEVAPGLWRVRIYSGALETCEYDGNSGDDHYRVVLWPSVMTGTQVVERRDVEE